MGRGGLGGEQGSGLLTRLVALLTELLLVGESGVFSEEQETSLREELETDLEGPIEEERDTQDELLDLGEAELFRLESVVLCDLTDGERSS